MRDTSRVLIYLLAAGVAMSFNAGGVGAASLALSGVGKKSSFGQHGVSPTQYRLYHDDDDDYDAPPDYEPPPVAPRRYAPPPAPYFDAPVYEWIPPRPADCGEYRYWNGEYCADARYHPPYVGPRW